MTDVNNRIGIQPAVRDELNVLYGNIATVEAGIPADGSITNAKMATDVKIGSLATLTTTEKTNIVGALNEVDGHADTALGRVAANQAIYAGEDHTALAAAFNTLLASLKTAGLMVAD